MAEEEVTIRAQVEVPEMEVIAIVRTAVINGKVIVMVLEEEVIIRA